MAKTSGSAQRRLDLGTSKATKAAKRDDQDTRRSVPPAAPANSAETITVATRVFADGQSVRIKIRDRGRFSGNSAEQMDGKSGAVERFSQASFNGDPPSGPAYLVKFDEPLHGWHAHQLPVEAFWFPPGDLEAT